MAVMTTQLEKIKRLLEKFYNQETMSAQDAHDFYSWAYGHYLKDVGVWEKNKTNKKGKLNGKRN
jgi:hypothetical protein